ncbi:hypothetical protein AGOR_G00182300 [Albula goreensis]|uniref:EF-hand domain-containing protein n=1 Tax=Albula goreensis TaxID=1534307 RepID=A0A8T3CSL0_9TELE|nr:hypothetical protein AGOR_G00182300 [Albula goreensis]
MAIAPSTGVFQAGSANQGNLEVMPDMLNPGSQHCPNWSSPPLPVETPYIQSPQFPLSPGFPCFMSHGHNGGLFISPGYDSCSLPLHMSCLSGWPAMLDSSGCPMEHFPMEHLPLDHFAFGPGSACCLPPEFTGNIFIPPQYNGSPPFHMQNPCSHFSPVPQDLVDDRMPNHSPADPETNTTNDGLCDSGTGTEGCEALATSTQCQTMSTMTEEQLDTVEENMMRPDSMLTSSRETTPEKDGELHIWETEVPKDLVGALIGKDGKYLKFIKQRCNGLVYMSTHPHYQDYMICNIMGTKQQRPVIGYSAGYKDRLKECMKMELRPLALCVALCVVYVTSKPMEKKDRVHHDPQLSDREHDDNENFDYDHDAFLGQEEAKTFDQLTPEESKERLGKIVDKIDEDKNGFVTTEEMKKWIKFAQKRWIYYDVDQQWRGHDLNEDGLVTWEEYKNATYGYILDDPDSEDRGVHRFLHPEEYDYMKDIVVVETMEDIDKNGDGFIDLEEYIGDMYNHEGDPEEPEWVKTEREQFIEFRDKNKDGKMDKDETRDWILPSDYDHAEAEAKHLVYESDADKDGQLTKEEIINKYDLFVGSQATDFGEALVRHDEF